MVHALEEGRRVLVPEGQLIDMRPISVDTRLEILSGETVEAAGIIDFSGGLAEDQAADQAIATLIQRHDLIPEATRQFEHAYYWEDLPSMRAYAEDRWSDSAHIPAKVYRKAEQILRKAPPPARIRVKLLVRLATYRVGPGKG